MTDTITVRDHTQPCEHKGQAYWKETQREVWFCESTWCPGGRVMVFEFFGRDGTDPDGRVLWVEATP